MQDPQRIPPHNLDAELSVLATILGYSREQREEVFRNLSPDHFYKKVHQEIYRCMIELDKENENIDPITVSNKLKTSKAAEDLGAESYLDKILMVIPSANCQSHVEIILEKCRRRNLIAISNTILSESYDESILTKGLVEKAEEKIFSVAQVSEDKSFKPVSKYAEEAFDIIANAHYKDGESSLPGVSSGFKDLDKITLGFKPGDMVILGARPSMGKTAFCLQIAKNVCVDDKNPCVIYSLEMPGRQLVTRLFSNIGRIDGTKLNSGNVKGEADKLMAALATLRDSPLFINDQSALTLYDIRNDLRRLSRELEKKKQDLSMVVIDYLQLIRSTDRRNSEQERVSELSRGIKSIAREFDVPVICLSQLSRKVEERADKRPMLSDLRESGAIEQDADQVLFLHRPEYYQPDAAEDKGIAEVILAKNRNGPTGSVKLHFDRHNASFQNLYKE